MSVKAFATGTLRDLAKTGIGMIPSPLARSAIGTLLTKGGLAGALYPGTADAPRNPDNNLIFGARELSEQQLRQKLGEEANFAASSLAVNLDEGAGITKNYDWRARLRPKNGGRKAIYGLDSGGKNRLLDPIAATGGMIWQYTPQIFLSATVNYHMDETHGSNYPILSYINSTPPPITATCEFTANNIDEARYLLAVTHYLKCITKSHYGEASVQAGTFGTPPPVLLFEYLGEHGFNKVPVVVRMYSVQFNDNIDYVPVVTNITEEEVTFVPTSCVITVDMMPSYTPHKLRKQFDIHRLTTGQAYKDGFI